MSRNGIFGNHRNGGHHIRIGRPKGGTIRGLVFPKLDSRRRFFKPSKLSRERYNKKDNFVQKPTIIFPTGFYGNESALQNCMTPKL